MSGKNTNWLKTGYYLPLPPAANPSRHQQIKNASQKVIMRQSISPRSPQPSAETPRSIMEAKLQQLLLDPEKLSLPEIIGYLKSFRTTLSQQGYDETETQAALDRVFG
jgi:hypothetical protein